MWQGCVRAPEMGARAVGTSAVRQILAVPGLPPSVHPGFLVSADHRRLGPLFQQRLKNSDLTVV